MDECKWLSGIKRVRGGKTLKIDLRICGDEVREIVISGDFFAHPEEMVDKLEDSLRGSKIRDINDILESYRGKILFTGISFDDLVELINRIIWEETR